VLETATCATPALGGGANGYDGSTCGYEGGVGGWPGSWQCGGAATSSGPGCTEQDFVFYTTCGADSCEGLVARGEERRVGQALRQEVSQPPFVEVDVLAGELAILEDVDGAHRNRDAATGGW
jgi:hypothetical protein